MHVCLFFFFFKQRTAYEMRISDWSSDVCSSDLFQRQSCTLHGAKHIDLKNPLYGGVGGLGKRPYGACDACVVDQRRKWTQVMFGLLKHAEKSALLSPVKVKIGRASCRERVCQYV